MTHGRDTPMPSPTRAQARARTRSHERGFTLIEVLIATAIIAIVVAAATLAIASTTRGASRMKTNDRQKAIASGVLNRVLSNRDWIATYSCGLGPCTISGVITPTDPLLREREGTTRHIVTVVATGVDLPNDNDASGRDADRQVPDVYRIIVTVRTQTPSSVGNLLDYTVDGTLDMSVRAKTGVLRLRACRVSSQVDERSGVGLCTSTTAQTLPILPPGTGAAFCPAAVPIASATDECAAWRQATASTAPGLAAVTQMRVDPYSTTFSLTGPHDGGAETTRTVTTNSTGVGEVTGLAPGRYTLTSAAVAAGTYRLWNSRSVPSGGEVAIQAGEVNDAVQVFKPAARNVTISLRRLDITDPSDHRDLPGAVYKRALKLVPVPNGRSALSGGTDRGWTLIVPGQLTATFNDLTPGLYQYSLLEYPGNIHDILLRDAASATLRFIWIPPAAGTGPAMTQVPSTLIIRDIYCEQARRTALYNARITATQVALGMRPHGFVWQRPGGGEFWHAPSCPAPNPDTNDLQVTGDAGA